MQQVVPLISSFHILPFQLPEAKGAKTRSTAALKHVLFCVKYINHRAFILIKSPQVDLGVPKTVRGVITQGARGGDAGSGATTDNRAFVRKYKVAHSLNGKEWNFIMDSKTSLPKVGEGGR